MAWLWWAVAAVLLAVIEMLYLDLIFIMLAGAALITVIPALLFPDQIILQAVVFAISAMVLVVAVRPIARRYIRKGNVGGPDINLPVGRHAVVVQNVDREGGRIKLHGEVWSARPEAEGWVFPVGADVYVTRIDGAMAIISAQPPPPPPSK